MLCILLKYALFEIAFETFTSARQSKLHIINQQHKYEYLRRQVSGTVLTLTDSNG